MLSLIIGLVAAVGWFLTLALAVGTGGSLEQAIKAGNAAGKKNALASLVIVAILAVVCFVLAVLA